MAIARRHLLVLLPLSMTLLAASTAAAQSSLQVPLQFDFLNPGARSLAMGSAFTGLADDATSAFTNPAGLILLRRPEISFEGRFRNITTPFLDRGRLSGTLTNRGDDTIAGAQYSESSATTGSPSFLSVVIPGSNWAIAGYRHELMKVRDSFQSRGVFQQVATGDARELPLEATREIDLANYGFSAAFRPNDFIAVGGGVSLYTLNLDSTFRRSIPSGDPIYGPPDYSNELFRITHTGDDSAPGFNVGVHISPNQRARIGVVYRKGPSFDVNLSETVSNVSRDGEMVIPDVFSAGVMIRPTDALTLAFDYSFVQYASLKEDYIDMQTSFRTENFVIDDANEFHGGVEYVFTDAPALPAIRFGLWYDPDHSVRYEPTVNDPFDLRFSTTLPGGEDLVHYTAGVGFSFSQQFELNAAGDFTGKRKTFSTSVIYRF